MQSAEVLKVKLYFSLIFLDTFFIHLFSFLSEETHLHRLHFFNPSSEGYFITQCLHQTGRCLSFCYLLGEPCLLTLKSHSAVTLRPLWTGRKYFYLPVFLVTVDECAWALSADGPKWWSRNSALPLPCVYLPELYLCKSETPYTGSPLLHTPDTSQSVLFDYGELSFSWWQDAGYKCNYKFNVVFVKLS